MVEDNGAYKHGRYENIRSKSLSNEKVFDLHDGWPAGHNLRHSHGSKTGSLMAASSL